MKKLKIFTLTAIVSMTFYLSCQKEQQESKPNQQNQSEIIFSEADRLVAEKIQAFIAQAEKVRENPQLKEGYEALTVDEAIWYTEAALNYTYGDYTVDYDELVADEAEFELAIEGEDLVDFTETALTYWLMDENTECFFSGIYILIISIFLA